MKLKAFIVASLLTISVGALLAQGQISGDAVCGDSTSTVCKFSDLKKVLSGTFAFLLQLAISFVVVMIMLTAAKVMTAQDKAGALKEAKTRLWNVVLGFLLFTVIVGGGYVAFLSFVKVDSQFMRVIEQLFSLNVSDILPVIHTYAQETGKLPNPLGTTTSLFDFLALLLSLVIRWFIFPVIIFSWMYTGFQYVYAQGNPQKLMEAHKWLWWTLIGTVTIMLAEGFTLALQGTFKQFFS
jgi:hypothetical protein